MPALLRLPAVLVLLGAACPRAQENVLVVLIDDWGTDNSALYTTGTNPPPTPRIDALAAAGVTFDNAWVQTMCSPTRAMLMTGRHAFRTGVRYVVPAGADLAPREITIPEHLRNAGLPHRHGAFGKWHLSDLVRGRTAPNDAGFDRYAGMFYGVGDYYRWERTVDGATNVETTWATTKNVDDALAWIQGQSGPWFCWFAPFSAHSPFQAPPPSLHTQNLAGLDPAVTPRPFYRAMVEATDTELGRLLDGLGPALANTHVIVLGDNGTPPEVVEPGLDPFHAKGSPYEPGVGVPLIVAGPAVQNPGRRVDALVSGVDLFATVSDLLGAPAAPPFARNDGVSFAPYLRDPATPPLRDTIFSELAVPTGSGGTCGFTTIRDARYKLIRRTCTSGQLGEELFDLGNDPLETNDLLQSPLAPGAFAALLRLGAEMDALQDVSARFERFGSATCSGSAGTPAMRSAGAPRLGATYGVFVDRAPASAVAALLLGSSETSLGGVPLPFDLRAIGGGAGCELLVSNEIVEARLTSGAGIASVSLALPDDPWLVGGTILHQWLVLDASANRLGVTTSDALRAVLGR